MSVLGSDQLHDSLMLIIPSSLTPLGQLGGELGSILQHCGQGPENKLQIPDSRFQGLSGPMSSEASCCQDMPLLPRLRITSRGLSHLQLFLRAKHLGKFCIFASTGLQFVQPPKRADYTLGFRLLFHSQQSHVDLTRSVSISPNMGHNSWRSLEAQWHRKKCLRTLLGSKKPGKLYDTTNPNHALCGGCPHEDFPSRAHQTGYIEKLYTETQSSLDLTSLHRQAHKLTIVWFLNPGRRQTPGLGTKDPSHRVQEVAGTSLWPCFSLL